MNWAPTDLLSDLDLQDYEADILSNFGAASMIQKRRKALEDWLLPILQGHGFDPQRLRTRCAADKVFAYTGAAYVDRTSAAADAAVDDLDVAAIFATPSADCLYIGSTQPFRGLFFRMLDAVTSVTSNVTVKYWNGAWTQAVLLDDTLEANTRRFGASSAIVWQLPLEWVPRAVNNSDQLYWAKVSVSATPTGAKLTQIGVIRASCLRAPAAFRTLQLIFHEAPTSQDGPWLQKAEFYKAEADAALQRALTICGGEFDTDRSDLVDADEAAQTPEETGGAWALERA